MMMSRIGTQIGESITIPVRIYATLITLNSVSALGLSVNSTSLVFVLCVIPTPVDPHDSLHLGGSQGSKFL